jgi:hypothetical protein
MRPPETLDDVVPCAMGILRSKRGSGAAVDDAFQLGLVNPLLASLVERAVISLLVQSQDWSPVQRLYHKNGQVFEWRIKLRSGQILPMFFDVSGVNNTAPVSTEIREAFYSCSEAIPVPDVTLISRFPLIKVEAQSAAEAADFIEMHLRKALWDGWQLGGKWALVDGWRNEYEFSRTGETTKMCFDMRPCLILDKTELTMFTLLAGRISGETFVKQQARLLVETGEARRAPPGSKLHEAVKMRKKNKLLAYFVATLILVAMPVASTVVYRFTESVAFSIIAFFSPICLYWLWTMWLFFDTSRMLRDSKRQFPDI